jgi:hypothetical protein
MFYQLLDLVIRHVLTWDLQRLLGLFSLPLLPSWYGLSDVYEPNRTMVCRQRLWETRPTTGVGYFHGLKKGLKD